MITRFIFASLVAMVSVPSFAYQVVSSSDTTISNSTTTLVRTEIVVQDGTNPLNRFTINRVRKNVADSELKGAVILLPGSSANFSLYELDENGNYFNSNAGYLASQGFDVWGYSPRSKGIAAGACTPLTGTLDCSVMADWGFDTILDDVEYIRQETIAAHPTKLPVVGGYSLGAITSLAVIDDQPSGYAGVIVWEGTLYSTDTLVRTGNAVNCLQAKTNLLTGQYAGGTTIAALKSLGALPPLVRDPALVQATTLPLPSPPSPVPNYTFFKGNLLGGFQYASMARLVASLAQYNDYESNAVARDQYCSLSGEITSYVDNLSAYTAPVLAIKAGRAFGPYMDENLALLGTLAPLRTTIYDPDFGHGDHYGNTNHIAVVDQPIVSWLGTIFP